MDTTDPRETVLVQELTTALLGIIRRHRGAGPSTCVVALAEAHLRALRAVLYPHNEDTTHDT